MTSNEKAWAKTLGTFFKAMFRLLLTVVSLITKFIAIGSAKISEWSIDLSDKLA